MKWFLHEVAPRVLGFGIIAFAVIMMQEASHEEDMRWQVELKACMTSECRAAVQKKIDKKKEDREDMTMFLMMSSSMH